MNEFKDRLECAKNVALQAGALANEYFNNLETLRIKQKDNLQDLVSQADIEVEDLIISSLKKAFSQDGFYGEERGEKQSKNNSYWLIDPIDGTANFLRGIPYYCISIAYIKNGTIELGLIYDPELKEMYTALLNEGAYMNEKKMKVANHCFEESLCAFGRSHRSGIDPYLNLVSKVLQKGGEYRRMGAGALSLAHVAKGRFDAYYEAHMYPWDATAGLLIAQEAGARTMTYMSTTWKKGNVVYAVTPSIQKDLSGILDINI